METFENKTVVNTPLCRRPNYHPFHNAVAKIINRNTISKPYSCNKQDFVSRFEITDSDHIKLKSGQKGMYVYTHKVTTTNCIIICVFYYELLQLPYIFHSR